MAGGSLSLDVEVDNDVDALISGANLTVNATDDVSVIAEEDADLRATAVPPALPWACPAVAPLVSALCLTA